MKLDSSSSSFATSDATTDPIETVTIVGGTHGNEYTGVWCIRAIERQRESYRDNRRLVEEGIVIQNNNDIMDEDLVGKTVVNGNSNDNNMQKNVFEMYPTIRIETLLGNPMAHVQNKRFVDVDLNRQFLRRRSAGSRGRYKNDDENNTTTDATTTTTTTTECYYEVTRAREIETLLGKRRRSGNNNNSGSNDGVVDVVIDLHTTTANMGITIILSEGYEPIMARAAAYALYRCRQYYSTNIRPRLNNLIGPVCFLHVPM